MVWWIEFEFDMMQCSCLASKLQDIFQYVNILKCQFCNTLYKVMLNCSGGHIQNILQKKHLTISWNLIPAKTLWWANENNNSKSIISYFLLCTYRNPGLFQYTSLLGYYTQRLACERWHNNLVSQYVHHNTSIPAFNSIP